MVVWASWLLGTELASTHCLCRETSSSQFLLLYTLFGTLFFRKRLIAVLSVILITVKCASSPADCWQCLEQVLIRNARVQ